jgi:hypothetical protein
MSITEYECYVRDCKNEPKYILVSTFAGKPMCQLLCKKHIIRKSERVRIFKLTEQKKFPVIKNVL